MRETLTFSHYFWTQKTKWFKFSSQHLLKYVSKVCGLNLRSLLLLDHVSDFLIQIAFQSSDRVKLDFLGSVIKIALNFKSRWTEEIELSSQGTYKFHILGNETLITADYKYRKLSNERPLSHKHPSLKSAPPKSKIFEISTSI